MENDTCLPDLPCESALLSRTVSPNLPRLWAFFHTLEASLSSSLASQSLLSYLVGNACITSPESREIRYSKGRLGVKADNDSSRTSNVSKGYFLNLSSPSPHIRVLFMI